MKFGKLRRSIERTVDWFGVFPRLHAFELGVILPSGDFWQCLEIFLVVTNVEGGVPLVLSR